MHIINVDLNTRAKNQKFCSCAVLTFCLKAYNFNSNFLQNTFVFKYDYVAFNERYYYDYFFNLSV